MKELNELVLLIKMRIHKLKLANSKKTMHDLLDKYKLTAT